MIRDKFPDRLYTTEEVRLAKSLIERGYRHRLRIVGSQIFKSKAREALKLIKTAGYHDFLRTYIRSIREVDGFSQLREAEASIWANIYAVKEAVEAASFFVQKAWQMKEYLKGELYYGHVGETKAINVRIKFLEALKNRSEDPKIREECKRRLRLWDESKFL